MINAEIITWKSNDKNSFVRELSQDELAIFEADVQDAIDGVLVDWGN
jgi:hypothetical protein